VNVPKAKDKVIYGKRLRSLFTVPEGRKMMGIDAAGLEARMEAHYCYMFPGGEEYAKELIEGDIHSKNAVAFGYIKEDGTPDRNKAKSPKYALTYGSQVEGLAETMGLSKQEAQAVFDTFWENNTALSKFRDKVTELWKQRGGKKGGFLRGLDGRKLYARSPHSLVNMMFQSAGSIVVKTASVFLDHWIEKEGLDAFRVIHQHDEFQLEYNPECEERLQFLAEKSFRDAGKYWNLNVPILGDVKIGDNWACTH
jgi:DNA polymerase I-like protein with 3'-5' exonuclease and polymerase domains